MKHCWGVKQTQTVGTSEKLNEIVVFLKRRSQISWSVHQEQHCGGDGYQWDRKPGKWGLSSTTNWKRNQPKAWENLVWAILILFCILVHICRYMQMCIFVTQRRKGWLAEQVMQRETAIKDPLILFAADSLMAALISAAPALKNTGRIRGNVFNIILFAKELSWSIQKSLFRVHV